MVDKGTIIVECGKMLLKSGYTTKRGDFGIQRDHVLDISLKKDLCMLIGMV